MRKLWYFPAFIVIGSIVVFGIDNASSIGVERQQWEYGRLQIGPLIDENSGMFQWEDGSGQKILSTKRTEFYSALSVTQSSNDGSFVGLYNALGNQGWELVQKNENANRIEVVWKRIR